MAKRACLEETGLVVERRGAGRTAETRSRVALQTEQIDIAYLQHVRVRPAMNGVAGLAAIRFDGRVLEDKWALLVRVALETDAILGRGHPHLLRPNRTVRVVAVAALNESLVDTMVEGHREFSLLREVAAVT